jgi:PAS domain S-box-containing protein
MKNDTGNLARSFFSSENREELFKGEPDMRRLTAAERESKYDSLFEFAPMAVFLGNTAGRILMVNQKAIELTGFAIEELLSMNFLSIFPDSDKAERKLVHDGISQGLTFSTETEINRKCGEPVFVEITVRVLKDDTRLVFLQDISEQKQIENSLREREVRLRELNATKDKFFSIIAHDLKSPFNAIVGFSNLMTEQIKLKDYDGIEGYAEIILNSSTRAMELLKNLLEWSRSQTGRMTFNSEYLDLSVLVRETTDLLKDSAQQKLISITTEMPTNMQVMADRAMINSVLRNLLSNAIKFTHINGHIVVKAVQNRDECLISIRDTGVGIGKENLSRLFRMDESFSTVGTHNEKGTGLGLLLSKEFVEKHGGKIWVTSEPGKGSIFYFTIPVVLY